MFKKIASIALAAAMLTSVAAIAASAAETEEPVAAVEDSAVGADDNSALGAEAGDAAAAGNTLSFDTNSAGWKNFKKVFCYVWEYGGSEFAGWGDKDTRCSDPDGDGVWTFDLSAAGWNLDSSKEYAVIFSNDNGMQTYDLLVGPACFGDTAYCDGTTYENPADSSKTSVAAFWKNQDKSKFGPVLTISSIGNVVGTCMRPSTTGYKMFVDFLKNTLTNAQSFSGKDDQTLLDDTAAALGLKADDVENAIKEAGVTTSWSKSASKLEKGSSENANTNNNTNNNSSNNSGNTGNSGSSTSGTGSVQSGEGTTLIFVICGVMLAAAGVIFLARKRRED